MHQAPLPVSLLDDARRRIKSNMQAIERRLRLQTSQGSGPSAESLLTSLQEKVVSMANRHRERCRSGDFEDVDLAVYLRRVAGALTAAVGRGPEEEAPEFAGWVVAESRRVLAWHDGASRDISAAAGEGLSLAEALDLLPWERREVARRALYAVGVMFPPTLFAWTAPEGNARQTRLAAPGQVSVRLGIEEGGPRIEVGMAEGSLGLPAHFATLQTRASFEQQLGLLLGELAAGAGAPRTRSEPEFLFKLVPVRADAESPVERIDTRLAS